MDFPGHGCSITVRSLDILGLHLTQMHLDCLFSFEHTTLGEWALLALTLSLFERVPTAYILFIDR